MRKLFWILYISVSAVGVILAALLMREYTVWNWYSLFPVGYMVLDILFALFLVSSLPQKLFDWEMEWRRVHYWGGEIDKPYTQSTYFITLDYRRIDAQIAIGVLPLWFLFVPFFGGGAKMLSGLILLAPACGILVHMIVDDHRSAKLERQKREAELRAQLSREQEGKWK